MPCAAEDAGVEFCYRGGAISCHDVRVGNPRPVWSRLREPVAAGIYSDHVIGVSIDAAEPSEQQMVGIGIGEADSLENR